MHAAGLPWVASALLGAALAAAWPSSAWANRYGTGASRKPDHVTWVIGGGPRPSAAGGKSVRDFGAVGDCTSDDTQAFEKAAIAARDAGAALVVPPSRGACYRISRVVTVYGSVIGVDYPLIKMHGANGRPSHAVLRTRYQGPGMWIVGLRLDGGFDTTGQAIPLGAGPPQWSSGIDIRDARNITISDNLIENTLGDSIYLGSEGVGEKNILIDSNDLRNAFRCNVALIHADWVVITNNVLEKRNTFVFAVDFEPNDPRTQAVWNVEVAYNDCTIPDRETPRDLPDSNLFVASAARSTGNGGNLYLHHNYGRFGRSDRRTGRGPAFWSDNNKPDRAWKNIRVYENRSTR